MATLTDLRRRLTRPVCTCRFAKELEDDPGRIPGVHHREVCPLRTEEGAGHLIFAKRPRAGYDHLSEQFVISDRVVSREEIEARTQRSPQHCTCGKHTTDGFIVGYNVDGNHHLVDCPKWRPERTVVG